ncbi:hypothetical protein [uncultured Shewanella sp.]|nr:hypothetical protein [uncultured Shewanella sp.]
MHNKAIGLMWVRVNIQIPEPKLPNLVYRKHLFPIGVAEVIEDKYRD